MISSFCLNKTVKRDYYWAQLITHGRHLKLAERIKAFPLVGSVEGNVLTLASVQGGEN